MPVSPWRERPITIPGGHPLVGRVIAVQALIHLNRDPQQADMPSDAKTGLDAVRLVYEDGRTVDIHPRGYEADGVWFEECLNKETKKEPQ